MSQFTKFVLAMAVVIAMGVGLGVLLGGTLEDLIVGILCFLAATAYGMVAAGVRPGRLTNAFFLSNDDSNATK